MKTIKVLGAILAILIVGIGCYLLDKRYSGPFLRDLVTKEYVDSTVTTNVQDIVNPLFNTVDEVLVFRDLTAEGLAIDEAFSLMPEEVLKNVASVLLNEKDLQRNALLYMNIERIALYMTICQLIQRRKIQILQA